MDTSHLLKVKRWPLTCYTKWKTNHLTPLERSLKVFHWCNDDVLWIARLSSYIISIGIIIMPHNTTTILEHFYFTFSEDFLLRAREYRLARKQSTCVMSGMKMGEVASRWKRMYFTWKNECKRKALSSTRISDWKKCVATENAAVECICVLLIIEISFIKRENENILAHYMPSPRFTSFRSECRFHWDHLTFT